MAKQTKTLREKSTESLQEMLLDLTKLLFSLRGQCANRQEKVKTHRFKEARRQIACIKTIIREREVEGHE